VAKFQRWVFLVAVVCMGPVSQAAVEGTDSAPAAASAADLVWLLVDKTALAATLQTLPPNGEPSRLIRKFQIAIGKTQGDKVREGDNKTPEGIYFSQPHIPGSQLWAKKYGPLAIPVDYPNPMDRFEGRSGYGIWLHGAGEDKRIAERYTTEGCIAFFNADILKVEQWLPPRVGIVVIADDGAQVNDPSLRGELRRQTEAWLQSWNDRDPHGYLSHYSPSFVSKGRNLHAYRTYKQRVFSGYKKIRVEATAMRILTHPKYAVTVMNQDFSGDQHYRSVGRKVLYWQREAGGWKIVRETFGSTQLKRF